MAGVWFEIVRDLFVVLLMVAVVEQIAGSDLLHDATRKGVVAVTVCVLVVKLVQPLLGSAAGFASRGVGPRGIGNAPKREKKTHTGKAAVLEWATSEMQGWRPAMEDSVCTLACLPKPLTHQAMFAVFDGHGGSQVSQIASQEFPKVVAACAAGLVDQGGSETPGDPNHDSVSLAAAVAALAAEEERGAAEGDARDPLSTGAKVFRQLTYQQDWKVRSSSTVTEKSLHVSLLAMDAFLRKGGAGSGPTNVVPGDRGGSSPSSPAAAPVASPVARNVFNFIGSTVIVVLVDSSRPSKPGPGEAEKTSVADGAGAASTAAPLVPEGTAHDGPPRRLTVANCGDSRALLCRAGSCVELSEDQKPECPEEEQRIRRAGGHVARVGPCHRIDGWGLNLSRALGDFHYKSRTDLPPEEQKVTAVPEVRSLELTEEDEFLVLACDGCFELLTSQQVVACVRRGLEDGKRLDKVVEELLDQCCSPNLAQTRGKGGDNCSAIVVKLR